MIVRGFRTVVVVFAPLFAEPSRNARDHDRQAILFRNAEKEKKVFPCNEHTFDGPFSYWLLGSGFMLRRICSAKASACISSNVRARFEPP